MMNKMKLCCVFNIPSLYRELIYKKIDISYDCDWYFEESEGTIKEFDTNQLTHVQRLQTFTFGPFYGVKGLISLLFKEKYTNYLMMGHSRNLSTLLFLVLKRIFFPNKKTYLWTHGFYGKESRIETYWKKILQKSADELFIYGDYACNLMVEKYGFDRRKIHVIHNSLDYDAQINLRNQMHKSSLYYDHFGNNNPVIIFIGRLTAEKKLDMLIKAIGELINKGEEYNLMFVGDGVIKPELETVAKKYNICSQVWFYGACYDEKQNAEFIYNADVCVAPGNIGLTAMHVLMFGCPAISHNDFSHQMPEFEAIKDGVTGTFFERDCQQSLDDAILRWMNQNNYNREFIRKNCYREIDSYWNPHYQMEIIQSVIK